MPRKYRNKPIESEDGRFDSKAEYRRWQELKLLEKAGEITHLQRQQKLLLQGLRGAVTYPNGRQAAVVVDFSYREHGELVYEDTKGRQTDKSKLQHAVLAAQGIEIRISR